MYVCMYVHALCKCLVCKYVHTYAKAQQTMYVRTICVAKGFNKFYNNLLKKCLDLARRYACMYVHKAWNG